MGLTCRGFGPQHYKRKSAVLIRSRAKDKNDVVRDFPFITLYGVNANADRRLM